MSTVLGIDLSTKHVDLVLLDEESPRASWQRISFDGASAFDRLRQVRERMPGRAWFDEHGVYLIAVEAPFGVSRGIYPLERVFGAVVASLPAELLVYEVSPAEWRLAIGLPGNAKKAHCADQVRRMWPQPRPDLLLQDACDAYAVALCARELNAGVLARAAA